LSIFLRALFPRLITAVSSIVGNDYAERKELPDPAPLKGGPTPLYCDPAGESQLVKVGTYKRAAGDAGKAGPIMNDKEREELEPYRADWKQVRPYALIALVAFVCGIALLMVFMRNLDKIAATGLTGKLFYVVLMPLGLCTSLVLFGVLRATARYSGKQFGGTLEVGGSAVIFFLVIILPFVLPERAHNFSVTIIVHGSKGNADMVLRSSGSIVLDTGGQRRTAPIGLNGEAIFLEIPADMRGRKASLGLDAEGFEIAETETETALTLSPSTFYVEVRKKTGRLAGYVKATNGQPLPGASLSVGKIQTTTDNQGYFELQFPGEEANGEVTLSATKKGYKAWTGLEFTNSNDVTVPLQPER